MRVQNTNISTPSINTPTAARNPQTGSLKGLKVASVATPKERPTPKAAPVLREGSRGGAVKELQKQLKTVGYNPGPVDGVFGPRTEAALKAYQRSHNISANGVFTAKTNSSLDRATHLDLPKSILRTGSRGEAVKDLQHALKSRGFNPGATDGVFGPRTQAALKSFQHSRGIAADGVYGPHTRAAFSHAPVHQGGGHSSPTRASGGSQGTHSTGRGSISFNGHAVSDPTLRNKIERIADFFGRHITVTSGDRDYVPPGGSRTSLHLVHRAVDLHVDGLSDAYVFSRLKSSGILSGGYEVIRHGPYTITGGPHVHIGHYGDGRSSTYRVEGLSPSGRGIYTNA